MIDDDMLYIFILFCYNFDGTFDVDNTVSSEPTLTMCLNFGTFCSAF